MTEKLLFDCFVQCSANRSFHLLDDDVDAWRSKQPPIIDILVVSEVNADVAILFAFHVDHSRRLLRGNEPRKEL